MRCPKCGYNSFDHLDHCKKCNIDLTEHKARFGIKSVLLTEALPDDLTGENLAAVVDEPLVAAAVLNNLDENFELPETTEGEDFGFDFMGESEEEEDLAFDELFDDVPSEETTEDSLPGPEAAEKAREPEPVNRATADEKFELPKTAKGEDFGVDFMGESEEEEDLAFDELFEDVPSEETTEDSLPEPENARDPEPLNRATAHADVDEADFNFDEDESGDAGATGLDENFDFGDADPAADIFIETEDFPFDEAEPKKE